MGVASMGVASMEVASSGSLINGNPIFTKNSRYLASFEIDGRDLLLHSFHPVIFSIS